MEREIKSIEIARLLVNELKDSNTPENQEKLYQWLKENEKNEALYKSLQDEQEINKELLLFENTNTSAAWERISLLLQEDEVNTKITLRNKISFRVAASVTVLLALAASLYFFAVKTPQSQITQSQITPAFKNDVSPGGNKASLILADGSVVILEDVADGSTISVQGTTEVKKIASGELLYSQKKKGEPVVAAMNTLTTPRGGQYHLLLPDGTEVWLNAATKLKYPSSFTGNERIVELNGEAYFEVKSNPEKPFRVVTRYQKTTVLGTRFNVNAYNDEPAEIVTLAEGKVALTPIQDSKSESVELYPGREAIVKDGIRTRIANIEGALAWKEGLFLFEQTELPVIMRQLARWYDVDIKYVNGETKTKFSGKLPRSLTLNTLLKILDLSDVKFRVEGRLITVM